MAENYIDKIEVDGVERPIRDTSIVPSDTTPKAPGTAVVGKETAYARGDHVHPKEVSDAERAAWNGKQTKITANGILKGNGAGGVSAAVAGTDYVTPSGMSSAIQAAIQNTWEASY